MKAMLPLDRRQTCRIAARCHRLADRLPDVADVTDELAMHFQQELTSIVRARHTELPNGQY